MSDLQLFTATVDGTKVFGFVEGLSFHYLKKSNHDGWIRYRDEIYHFTDLHEVKVVDMDAVVIEGVSKAELVAELKDAQSCLTDLGCCVDDRHGLIPFLAQLSTPAEPATGGEMKSPTHETTEISSTSLGTDENAHLLTCWRDGLKNCKCHPAPTSPKGVWIELSEYDRINVETAMKSILLPTPLDEIIAKIYNAIKLTPTQSESEKFFAHLNNGGKICVDTTDLSLSGAYWISLVISPEAGGE